MVSTEENSLGDILGAALPKGVLAGLKGVTSPDAPIAYSAPTNDEPMAPGAAQAAAVAYLHDAPAQPRPNTADAEPHAPQLQLVADHGAAHGGHARSSGEEAEAEALRAARAVAINTVEDMIAEARTNNDTAAIARLQSVLQNLRGAKTLAALAAAQTALGAIDSDQKGEDKEQKIERLREEIARIDESLDEQYKRMVASGQMSQATYDNWKRATEYAAAHPDDAKAQTAAQAATEKATQEAEHNATTPEQTSDAGAARDRTDKRRERVMQVAGLEKSIVESQAPIAHNNVPEANPTSIFDRPENRPQPVAPTNNFSYSEVESHEAPPAALPNQSPQASRGGPATGF